MTRRITIARDGTVKLRGKATRWRVTRDDRGGFGLDHPSEGPDYAPYVLRDRRAQLESLTDEELMG